MNTRITIVRATENDMSLVRSYATLIANNRWQIDEFTKFEEFFDYAMSTCESIEFIVTWPDETRTSYRVHRV